MKIRGAVIGREFQRRNEVGNGNSSRLGRVTSNPGGSCVRR